MRWSGVRHDGDGTCRQKAWAMGMGRHCSGSGARFDLLLPQPSSSKLAHEPRDFGFSVVTRTRIIAGPKTCPTIYSATAPGHVCLSQTQASHSERDNQTRLYWQGAVKGQMKFT